MRPTHLVAGCGSAPTVGCRCQAVPAVPTASAAATVVADGHGAATDRIEKSLHVVCPVLWSRFR